MNKNNNVSKKTILKIISVFIAVVLWLIITYTEDSQMDFTVNSIDIRVNGESELNERGLMVINKLAIPKASVRIRGKRGDIIEVMDNISASVDVSAITGEGTAKLVPSFDIPSNAVYISNRKTNAVDIDIAKMEEKTIDVRVVQNNESMNEKYMVESIPEKKSVVIKGEKKDIESIDHAAVYVDVGAVTKNGTTTETLIYENSENSEIICANDLFCEIEQITISNKVYEKNTIPIKIEIPYEVSKRYSVDIVEQEIEAVEVGIVDDVGKMVSEIKNLPFGKIPEEGTHEYEIELEVPDGLYIPKDKQKIKVKLEVYEKKEMLLTIPVKVENTQNRNYEISKHEVSVWVSGPEEKLKSENVTAIINLDKYPTTDAKQVIEVELGTKEKDLSIENKKIQIEATIN